MKEFSAGHAAFAIFDFAKHNRGFVLKYIGFYVLFMVVYFAGLWLIGYFDIFKIIAQTGASTGAAPPNDAEFANMINQWSSKTAPLAFLIMIVSAVLFIMFASAVWRKMLRNEEIGFHGLTWGKDENRMLLSFIVWIAIYFGAYFGTIFVSIISVGISSVIYQFSVPVGTLVGFILVGAAICGFIFLMVRLSQFGVLTIATRKMATIDSFKETRGHFWSFFGAHILFYVVIMVVFLIILAIVAMIAGIVSVSSSMIDFDLVAAQFMKPYMLILVAIVVGAFSGFISLWQMCIGAYAYKIMHDGEELPQEPEPTPHVWPTLGE